MERVLRLADGDLMRLCAISSCALSAYTAGAGYQRTLAITSHTTKAVVLISMTPDAKKRGLATQGWPSALPNISPTLAANVFVEELDGNHGSLLEGRDLKGPSEHSTPAQLHFTGKPQRRA